jgi:hypothetical protein
VPGVAAGVPGDAEAAVGFPCPAWGCPEGDGRFWDGATGGGLAPTSDALADGSCWSVTGVAGGGDGAARAGEIGATAAA